MAKCIRCNREADYVSPDSFCKFHWLEWWYDGAGPSYLSDEDEEKAKVEEKLLNLIRTDKPEDQETLEELYEKHETWIEEDTKD